MTQAGVDTGGAQNADAGGEAAVLPGGAAVLNAAEPQLVEMAKLCDGEVIFFASDPELPALVSHIEQGRRAVIVRYGQVMLADSEGEAALTRLGDIPLTEDGKNREQIEISRYYERLPKPAIIATEEFLDGELFYKENKEAKES